MKVVDRRLMVDGWLWWATFRLGIGLGFGISAAAEMANRECAVLWAGQP